LNELRFTAYYYKASFCSVIPSNLTSLLDTLKTQFPEFSGVIFYVSTNGDFLRLPATDEESKVALSTHNLKLFLLDDPDSVKRLERRFFCQWLEKNNCKALLIHSVIALVNEGFKKKDIINNYELLISFAGDAEGAVCAFHSVCQKTGSKKKEKEEKKLKKRKSRADVRERKAERRRRKKAKVLDASKSPKANFVGGQTNELVEEFQSMSLKAYQSDVLEKLLAGHFKKVILDGNNMLYITSVLRNFTIKGNRAKAERMLSIAAFSFSQILGINTEIMFDDTSLPGYNRFTKDLSNCPLEIRTSGCSSPQEFSKEISKIMLSFPLVGVSSKTPQSDFLISSARPHFPKTDDKLIAWAKLNMSSPLTMGDPSNPTRAETTTTTTSLTAQSLTAPTAGVNPNSTTLVVSSDRALAGELSSLGVALVKPSRWVYILSSLVEKIGKNGEQLGNDVEMENENREEMEKAAGLKWLDTFCLSFFPENNNNSNNSNNQ